MRDEVGNFAAGTFGENPTGIDTRNCFAPMLDVHARSGEPLNADHPRLIHITMRRRFPEACSPLGLR